ncbi:MAG: metallopeptidase family protein [Acidobacteriota bacterium]|nr:metallopeptidase family protein [Acidobacteriota bacterium]MDW3228703.1 metallopeptidase family protein [Acidobacteriota bacterium]MDY0231399.1 metallopeptidase family protein [Candidatus Saccharicenans sp.]
MRLTREKFQQLVEEAFKNIPKKYLRKIDNVAILVEDYPPPGQSLLGLYHGVPLKHRGSYYGNIPPDVIVLYKVPIESLCQTKEQVREKIEEVLWHEVGHYFGLDEKTLREIELWKLNKNRKKH